MVKETKKLQKEKDLEVRTEIPEKRQNLHFLHLMQSLKRKLNLKPKKKKLKQRPRKQQQKKPRQKKLLQKKKQPKFLFR